MVDDGNSIDPVPNGGAAYDNLGKEKELEKRKYSGDDEDNERSLKEGRKQSSKRDENQRTKDTKRSLDDSRKNRRRRKRRDSRQSDDSDRATESDSDSDRSKSNGDYNDERSVDRNSRKSSSRKGSSYRSRHQDRRRRREREDDHKRKKKHSRSSRSSRRGKKRKRRRSSSSSSSSSSDSSDSGSSSDSTSSSERETRKPRKQTKKKVVNARLLAKLAARGETLEEREARRARARAARIASEFGYTPEDNPFRDPNLHEPFRWKKKEEIEEGAPTETDPSGKPQKKSRSERQQATLAEIEKVRYRRVERERQLEENERLKAEESRMREQENYDEWLAKEEGFHLRQQKQRSAIRLVEGRERPIDVLAKNILLFGENYGNHSSVKYNEKYDALKEVGALEVELEEPYVLLRKLQMVELRELEAEVREFCTLEREAHKSWCSGSGDATKGSTGNTNEVLEYWEAIGLIITDEITRIQHGGESSSYVSMAAEIYKLFENKTLLELHQMAVEISEKVDEGQDPHYWKNVKNHLIIFTAKTKLSELHSRMLVRQLEKLEARKQALSEAEAMASQREGANPKENGNSTMDEDGDDNLNTMIPSSNPDFRNGGEQGDTNNLEEELGISDEVLLKGGSYTWQEKYRPRKPRYFNRVKTGYDWNKYNQTHYDHDNPPPKIVQGYKFNVFYPDLIDRTKTPTYRLESCGGGDENAFCIIRFSAGPPYEDLAFKIINREWNKSRKRGFRCTFDRGVLSVYFNFNSHWYRR